MTEVFASPRSNGRPQRLVVLRQGDREHRDKIDCDSAFQREQLLQRAAAAWELDPVELTGLDGELVKQADAADADDARDRKPDANEKIDYHLRSCAELVRETFDIRFLIDCTF